LTLVSGTAEAGPKGPRSLLLMHSIHSACFVLTSLHSENFQY